jgi:hypothetical protein
MRRLAVVVLLAAVCGGASVASGAQAPRRAATLQVYGGLGSWLDIFAVGAWSKPDAIVAAAKAHGVQTLYLQTSNYSQASDIAKPAALGRFVDAAHAAGLKVVAWYLPGLFDPRLDARRTLAAVRFRSAHGEAFDGFGLDIEASIVEPVSVRNARLLALARLLRRSVPSTYPLGAIIPSPVGMRRHPHYWPRFPYAGLARSFDAFLPMAYFSYYEHTPAGAYDYARSVVLAIRAGTGRPDEPIHVIGGSSDDIAPSTLAGFVRAVSDCAAQGISLYAFPQTSAGDWTALAASTLDGTPDAACSGNVRAPRAHVPPRLPASPAQHPQPPRHR